MTFTKATIFLQELMYQIHHSTSLNLSIWEIVIWIILGLMAWRDWENRRNIQFFYSIFLILYITLLRREPIHQESIRWSFRFDPSAKIWAGNLLNILLYIPLGWTAARIQCQKNWIQLLLLGASLSVFCECVQHLTERGCADVNDVLWNVVGMAIGALGWKNTGALR